MWPPTKISWNCSLWTTDHGISKRWSQAKGLPLLRVRVSLSNAYLLRAVPYVSQAKAMRVEDLVASWDYLGKDQHLSILFSLFWFENLLWLECRIIIWVHHCVDKKLEAGKYEGTCQDPTTGQRGGKPSLLSQVRIFLACLPASVLSWHSQCCFLTFYFCFYFCTRDRT